MIYLLDLFGIAVFAITGALAAGRKRLDIFGVVVVALVTALGGGTLRDIVLDARPLFWVADPRYVIVAAAAAIATFFTARSIRVPFHLLLLFDALGLAFFTITGCQKAALFTPSATIIAVMGMMTGVAGGIIRDILCGEIPVILRREIYATASLSGCILFIVLSELEADPIVAAITAMVIILIVRLAAIRWHLSLPIFEESDRSDTAA